jgi:hypothetical protein
MDTVATVNQAVELGAERALLDNVEELAVGLYSDAAEAVVAVVAPLIRADVLATLHARIEALPQYDGYVRRQHVLAVIKRLTREGAGDG